MTKRIVSLFLCLLMVLSCCAAFAESEYAEHLDISVGTRSALNDDNWKDVWFNQMIQEKFNVSFEMYSAAASFDEVTNTWISMGEMPDWMTATGTIVTMVDFAEQGLLAALPDGWQEKYPRLAKEVEATALEPMCTIDGVWYFLPRVVYSPNLPLDFASKALEHTTQYYRTDMIDEEIPSMITIKDLRPYVEEAIANKAAQGESIYGISADKGQLIKMFVQSNVPYYSTIYKINGEYVLGAAQEGVIEGIQELKDWYDAGLIDPDFFTRSGSDILDLFAIGKAFMTIWDGSCEHAVTVATPMLEANPDMNGIPSMAVTNILHMNGVDYVNRWASTNWRTICFNPNMENDPEKFDRVLAMLDFLADPETVCMLRLGEKGVDWDYDEYGFPYVINEYVYDEANGSKILYHLCPSSQDAFAYGYNPSVPQWAKDMGINQMNEKTARVNADLLPSLEQLQVDDNSTTDAHVNFRSIGWGDEIIRIVVTGDVDVATEWNNFIDANEAMWRPWLEELNASLAE